MAAVTPAALKIAFEQIATDWWTAYKKPTLTAERFAKVTPMGTEYMLQAWMQMIPKAKLWNGPRTPFNPAALTWETQAAPYVLDLEIDRFKFLDDAYMHGVFQPALEMMALQCRKLVDYGVRDILANGATYSKVPCFDGKALFATDHPIDPYGLVSGTYQNYYASGYDLTPANFATVYQNMVAIKGPDGEPMGIRPNLLITGPANIIKASQVLNSTFFAPQTFGGTTNVGAQDNILKGLCDIVVMPELATDSANPWFLVDSNMPIKPIVIGERMAPELLMITDPTHPYVLERNAYRMTATMRYVFSSGIPWLIARAQA